MTNQSYRYEYHAVEDSFHVWLPYDPDIVAEIKTIPYQYRKWNPEAKCWHIKSSYWDTAKAIFEEYGYNGIPKTVQDDTRHNQSMPTGIRNTDYDALCLTEKAPPELIKAAYRILIRMNHPDVGGSEEVAKRINGAYQNLAKDIL